VEAVNQGRDLEAVDLAAFPGAKGIGQRPPSAWRSSASCAFPAYSRSKRLICLSLRIA
jgi:hypothetical protein